MNVNNKIEPLVWEKFVSQMSFAKNVFSNNPKVLVAVSGGPDSMFLSYLIYKYSIKNPIKPILCYINHNVRSQSTIKKEVSIIKKFASNFNLPFVYSEIKTKKFDENTLRIERYEKLFSIAKKLNCSLILTGHTRDDVVETFLFNLFRGSGIKGLTGISSFREVLYQKKKFYLLRPLIKISKEEILKNLNFLKIKFSVDKTNYKNFYTRNFIRNIILKKVKKVFNKYDYNIINTIDLLTEIQEYLSSQVENYFNKVVKVLNKKHLQLDFKKFIIYNSIIKKEILHKILDFLFTENRVSIKSGYNKIINNLLHFFNTKRSILSINKNLIVRKNRTKILFKAIK